MTTPHHHSSHVPPARPSGDGSDDTWTTERIRALGPVTDLTTAARIFGLSRSVAYDLAKRGQFPVAVLRFGSRYRVPVAAILHALHLPPGDDPGHSTEPPDGDLIPGGRHAWITPYRIHSHRLPPPTEGNT
ncbi:helix-turn-helix domain-containing protein [Micromonospora sp. URMC 106]|uniref:helix-turn-helix domain-containing protein n=1 Tax=Micromonospora sp. URMC 106 TaxID=3423408 RepID=UPI003F1CF19F